MGLPINSLLHHRITPSLSHTRSNGSNLGVTIAMVAGVAVLGAIGAQALKRRIGRTAGDRSTGATHEPEVERSLTIERSPEDLYGRWKDPRTFQRIIKHFARVDALDERRARWSANGPLGVWHMRLVEDRINELMRWQPEEASAPLRESTVRFTPAQGRQGTVVTMQFRLDPPGGVLGRAAAKFMHGVIPGEIASKTLRFFKSLVLTGEIPTTVHQPAARPESR